MCAATVITLGCRLNAYESEVMRAHAEASGRETVIVNTCAVTAEAERQARQAIRRARREHPAARLVVTGCSAQIDPARYAAMTEVDQVLGNSEKMQAQSFLDADAPRVRVNDIASVRETAEHLVAGFEGRARAFLEVQQGCDHACTFCIIPRGRGPSRSVPLGEIVRQARLLIETGTAELVLTGVDLTAYGADLPGAPTLGQMARRLLAQLPELRRLRLSSLDPIEIDDALWRLIGEEERVMPHLHLSIQAGDDMILKRMKRRHSRADALAAAARARSVRPEIALGADLIAGFPTETEEMFANTLRLVEEAGLTFLHVFPYSSRPGTPAARMPQVPHAVRKQRAERLRQAGAAALARHLAARVDGAASVLAETDATGHAEDFSPVRFEAPASAGAIVAAEIVGSDGRHLIARTLP
ncbi:MAG TPA: tRNA (N(6)-L-threonylcarbamoyladenosine(37)-C(2))-methylthiotransferase MtaB [Methylomirabilota bacterium]|jgi:threonylcarbamoyladenosine tRNA methylthiotransferase MtaB|nr:tRNA (N(6)-L-threonylcarbamoyladenosine(37)-C(2))-methylthiotransferase MtaB [Methylomirabilota bacterium]